MFVSFLFSRHQHGLLLAVKGRSSTDGLIVSLVNGRIRLFYSHLLSYTSITNQTYNDGEMHTFQVTFTGGRLLFVVDGREQFHVFGDSGQCIVVYTKLGIFITTCIISIPHSHWSGLAAVLTFNFHVCCRFRRFNWVCIHGEFLHWRSSQFPEEQYYVPRAGNHHLFLQWVSLWFLVLCQQFFPVFGESHWSWCHKQQVSAVF